MKTRTAILATTAAMLALGLGACSNSSPDAEPAENSSVETIDTPTPSPTPLAEERAPVATPTSDAVSVNASAAEDEPAPAPDEQMMDDASATGMTARAQRGDQSSEDAPPADTVEQK